MSSSRRLRSLTAAIAVALGVTLAVTAPVADAAASYSSTVVGDAPTGYWRLGETGGATAADASGHGHSGSYSGGVTLGTAGAIAGDANTAATFNGSTGQVSIADAPDLQLNGAFTIELWAKMSTFVNSYPGLLNKGTGNSSTSGYLIWYASNGTLHFKRNNYDFATTAGALTTNGYQHLVVTYDGTTARWYVGGTPVRSATVSYPANTGTAALVLGRGDQAGAESLDEVALYNKALTATQVANHYNQGTSAGTSPTPTPTSASPTPTATSASPTPTPTATSASPTPTSASPTPTPSLTTPPSGADPVIAAAGDIACDPTDANYRGGKGSKSYCHQLATARLLGSGGYDRVFALGDEQYADATLDKFRTSYDPSWGQFKSITVPVPGNHEYLDGNAEGYYAYFGAAAGDPQKGYYSFNLDTWHVIVLNGECSYVGGCGAGTPQETWLRADLAAHPSTCTLAMWHEPRFASGSGGDSGTGFTTFWTDLYNAGAEVILNGHIHDYERFAPQTPSGAADSARGIREFVVGTGGKSLVGFDKRLPNSQVTNSNTYGVLAMTLHPSSYSWEFIPEAGKSFTDSGTTSCH